MGVLALMTAGIAGFAMASEKKSPSSISLQIPSTKPEAMAGRQPVLKSHKPQFIDGKMSARLKHMISRRSALREKHGKLPLDHMERRLFDRREIRVIFHTIAGYGESTDKIKARGARILKVRDNLVAVKVPIDKIEEIVTHVKGVVFARFPHRFFPAGVISEGVNLSGAANFHAAGNTGSDVKIAVVDAGFKGLSEAQSNGDIPYNVITYDYSAKGLQTEYKHGTACAEIVHDMAPDAELHVTIQRKNKKVVRKDLTRFFCENAK